ncbi:DUF2164 domain-containing protein [Ferrimonas balearica]|uniref:DUF2164 domain-containing protein n=1 Tax=Ferrimonas balearica TaxID=44012 RepID=UPI001C9A113E|nr:DUF2164 domain-containing protein [Ferrimonas balearica]MBY5922569.1 DUF2164 domain-containing protein [Ferrimonas balearica]MBY5995553.1 DUF2164 domain-containing protein [Ferrimonas balearica]
MITLEPAQRQALLRQLSHYCEEELDRELGQFEAEFLLDFILKTLGPVLYNQGLYDAQALLQPRLELVLESLHELEKVPE